MQQQTRSSPQHLVCVAAPEDASLLGQWETHLRPLEQAGLISVWSERHLVAGASREQVLELHLENAHLILLLLSADFFSSPDCLAMMERALERSHEGTARLIPLLLRPVAWQESSLHELACWPSNGVPITQWNQQDEAWHTCIQDLRRLLGRRVSKALSSERFHKHADPDWERMLRRLRRSYKELLDQSLHGIAWVELGLATQSDMVSNVTNLLFRLPQGGKRLFAPGTRVLDAYDEAEGELLILGAPGAGKSTLLLELAQQLVNRALADPTQPLPVILRLSSWTVRPSSLANWMVEQLSRTYDVPRQLAERWVQQGRLLPLLDGLDEMEEAARSACIAAINTHHRTQLTPLVVCSRQAEYEVAAMRERLVLQSAVIVQPLSEAQVEGALRDAGSSFAGVRTAWSQEPALRELATTPLMLSVLLLTYRGATASEIIGQGAALEQQVWRDYIVRQVTEKGNDTRYPLQHTSTMLSWLAQQMRLHQQSIFYAEYLQIDWLTLDQQRTLTWLAIRLPAAVIGACVCLLISLFLGNSSLLLQLGLLGGFVGGSLSQQVIAGPARSTRRVFNEKLVSFSNAVLPGLLLAASYGLFFVFGPPSPIIPYSLGDWVRDGSIVGLGSGFSFWICQRLLHRTSGRQGSKNARWLWGIASRKVWQAAAVLGVGVGLSAGLSLGLQNVLSTRLSAGQSLWSSIGLSDVLNLWLNIGLSISSMMVLLHVILTSSIGPLHFAERIHWTWRSLLRLGHLRTSLSMVGALWLLFTLSDGLGNTLSYELSYGLGNKLSYELSYGLGNTLRAGLIRWLPISLSVGLSYWIVLGLYQGMYQEHLDDQDRQQFNQGIRRSLCNGLLLSLISALIMSTIGVLGNALMLGLSIGLFIGQSDGLDNGLSAVLRFGLSEGLSMGLRNVWIWLLTSMVVMWALSGGLTVLRHYVIRWLQARHRTFPWRAQAFLDDATIRILLRRVGGGYSFIHRRLQDYFADAVVPPPQK